MPEDMLSLELNDYVISINWSLLKQFLFMENSDEAALDASVNFLKGENNEDYLLSLIISGDQAYHPARVREVISSLKLTRSIADFAIRITV